MKYLTSSFLLAIGILISVSVAVSCSRNEKIAGAWTAPPVRLDGVPDAADALATVTVDFGVQDKANATHPLNLSALIDVTQPVEAVHGGIDMPYEVSVAATASISGRYTFEKGEDDDVVVTLDPSSMKVDIDPAGVTFSQNVLTGLQQPRLDSLTEATVSKWRVEIARAVRSEFYKYTSISDIKIHHADMMTCEISDRDYTLRRN